MGLGPGLCTFLPSSPAPTLGENIHNQQGLVTLQTVKHGPEPVEVCWPAFNRSSPQNDLVPGCAWSLLTQQMRCLEGPAWNPCAGR